MDFKKITNKENLLGYGSNRIVFDLGDGTVLKVPYNNVGIECNRIEYENYQKKPEIVAKVYSFKDNLIVQEKLSDVITVPYIHTVNKTVKTYLAEQGVNIGDKLLKESLNTKFQIGKDTEGFWKFFDYEDAKLKEFNFTKVPFKMNEERLNSFWKYLENTGVNNITRWNTFQDSEL